MTDNYLRLYRSRPNYRWWRPLVAVALAALLIISVSAFFGVVALMATAALSGGIPDAATVEALFVPDVTNPISVALSLLSVAAWIPLIFFSLWAVGIKPLGMLNSVAFRLRWNRIGKFAISAVAVVVLAQTVSVALTYLAGEGSGALFTIEPLALVLSLLAVLLLVPFQAAAEEYAFRGILMQALGSWMKTPIVPIVLPTVLFMLAHAYDIWGLLEVLLLGVTAAWLTYKTGGLEAAIVIHVINNVSVFLLLLSGVFGTTMVLSDAGSPVSVAITAVMLAGYAVWVLRLHRAMEDSHEHPPTESEVEVAG